MMWILIIMCAYIFSVCCAANCPAPIVSNGEVSVIPELSPWGQCDQSCGGGIQVRRLICTYYGRNTYWYLNGYPLYIATRNYTTSERSTCNEVCAHGSFINGSCHCLPGIKGRCCDVIPVCKPSCGRHGSCIADNTCKCQSGFYGRWCEIGGTIDETLRPHLHTTLPLADVNNLMSWYDAPTTSDYCRACYIKVNVQNGAGDTLVNAESRLAANGGPLFGSYSVGPIDENGQLHNQSRSSCLQVKCPGESLNGTSIDVAVNVTIMSKYKTCALRTHVLNLSDFKRDDARTSYGFTLEQGRNYGSAFGVYIGMGFRDLANHIALQSCLSGRRFDQIHINPSVGTMADFVCT